jgi:hypothetical protein
VIEARLWLIAWVTELADRAAWMTNGRPSLRLRRLAAAIRDGDSPALLSLLAALGNGPDYDITETSAIGIARWACRWSDGPDSLIRAVSLIEVGRTLDADLAELLDRDDE